MPLSFLRTTARLAGAVRLLWTVLTSVLLSPLGRGGGGGGDEWTAAALTLLPPPPPRAAAAAGEAGAQGTPPPPASPPAVTPAAGKRRLSPFLLKARPDKHAGPAKPAWRLGAKKKQQQLQQRQAAGEAAATAAAAAAAPLRPHPPKLALPNSRPDWTATVVAVQDYEAFLRAFNDGAGLMAAHAAAPELSRLAVSPWVASSPAAAGAPAPPPPRPIPGGPRPGSPGCGPPADPATPAVRTMSFVPRGVRWLPLRVAAVGINELAPRAAGAPALMSGSAAARWGGGGGHDGQGGGGRLTRLVSSTMVARPAGPGAVVLELRCSPTLPPLLGRLAAGALRDMSAAFAGRSASAAASTVGGRVLVAGKGAAGVVEVWSGGAAALVL
jgi:hypothetical protein